MKHFRATAAFAALVLAFAVIASPCRAERAWAGLHFDVADLKGDFDTRVDRHGYGLSAEGWLEVGRKSPLVVGVRGGFVIYGQERDRVPLSPTIPGVWVELDRTNNLVLGQLLARLQTWQGDVRPYGEAFLGLNYLYTSTTVKSETTGVEFAGSKNWSDTALAWGLGGGVLVRLGRTAGGPIYVDLGATLVKGGRAEYLAEGGVQVIDDQLVYFLHDSYTDYLLWRVGVVFGFL